MKINPQYQVRDMAGEHVIVLPGRLGVDMTRVISLNESSLYLWEKLHDTDFTAEEAAQALVEHYEIDLDTARRDAGVWCKKLQGNGLAK